MVDAVSGKGGGCLTVCSFFWLGNGIPCCHPFVNLLAGSFASEGKSGSSTAPLMQVKEAVHSPSVFRIMAPYLEDALVD